MAPPIKRPTFSISKAMAAQNAPEKFIDRAPKAPVTANKISTIPTGSTAGSSMNWNQLAGDLLPYASNIINSFRKPPLPKNRSAVPLSISPRIKLDARREQIANQIRTANASADRGLDENTAAAVKRSNQAGQLRELSNVAENEANINAQIASGDAQLNSRINMYNASKTDEFNDMLTERELAQTRFSQQNLADVADKYMAQQQQRDAANLDMKKYGVLKTLWSKSGVNERVEDQVKKTMKDMGYAKGGRLKMYAGGGQFGGDEDIEVIVTDADRKMVARDSYTKNLFGAPVAEQIYASGFRPRTYGDKLVYTDNSDVFTTDNYTKQIGYMPDGTGGFRRVLIKDNNAEINDDGVMDSNTVMNEIKRLHKGRSNQLMSQNNSPRIKINGKPPVR